MEQAKHSHQLKWSTFFLTFLVTLGQWCFGYPASVISTTLGEPPFLLYMGLVDPQTGTWTSRGERLAGATNGVFFAGGIVNVFINACVLDRFGRRWANTLQCGSGTDWRLFVRWSNQHWHGTCVADQRIDHRLTVRVQFVGGRALTGMSAFGFIHANPIYSAELSPPMWRGFFTGFNGVNIAAGYSISAWTGIGSFFAVDPVIRWRLPLGLYLVFPVMMIALMFVVPESPRWLLHQKRVEDARKIVDRLHRSKSHPNEDFVKMEFFQMSRQAALDQDLDNSWTGLLGVRYHKRTAVCSLFAFVGQSTAILFIFVFIYNIGVDVSGACYYAEAFRNHIRSKGVAVANASLALADLIYLEVTPTAFAHVGWKFFLLFLLVSSVGWVVLFFWLAETNDIPLEEMARIFGDQNEVAVELEDLKQMQSLMRMPKKTRML